MQQRDEPRRRQVRCMVITWWADHVMHAFNHFVSLPERVFFPSDMCYVQFNWVRGFFYVTSCCVSGEYWICYKHAVKFCTCTKSILRTSVAVFQKLLRSQTQSSQNKTDLIFHIFWVIYWSPLVRESKTVLDSGFHAVSRDSRHWIPDSLSVESRIQIPGTGFQISWAVFRVSEPTNLDVFLIPDSTSKNLPDSDVWIPLYGAIRLRNAVINHYTESTCIVD